MSTLKVNQIQPYSGDQVEIVAGTLSTNGVSITTINVTASGDISASGTIFANNFQSAGGDVSGITFVDHTSITGNVTASGMISASGHLYGDHAIIDDLRTRLSTFSGTAVFEEGMTIGGTNINGEVTNLYLINTNGSLRNLKINEFNTTNGFLDVKGHITASGDISSSGGNLTIAGTTQLEGDTTISSPNKLYLGSLSGLHIYSEGTNADQNQIILAKTNDLKLMNQSHGKSIVFSTEDAAGSVHTPLTLTGAHVTASGNISGSGNLTIGGTSQFDDTVTIPKLTKLYFTDSSGMHIYSEGTATNENQIILAKTNDLKIMNQAHGKDIIFSTENASGVAQTPLTLKGDGSTVFGTGTVEINGPAGQITASGNISSSGDLFVTGTGSFGSNTTLITDDISTTGDISSSAGNVFLHTHLYTQKNLRAIYQEGGNGMTYGNTTSQTKIESVDQIIFNTDAHVVGHLTASNHISASGNIIGHSFITDTQTVAAAGSGIGDATTIAPETSGIVFCTTDDAAKGVKLPAVSALAIGTTLTIHNTSAANLEVYPTANDRIFPLADDAPATVPANTAMVVTAFSADGYVGYFTTIIS